MNPLAMKLRPLLSTEGNHGGAQHFLPVPLVICGKGDMQLQTGCHPFLCHWAMGLDFLLYQGCGNLVFLEVRFINSRPGHRVVMITRS